MKYRKNSLKSVNPKSRFGKIAILLLVFGLTISSSIFVTIQSISIGARISELEVAEKQLRKDNRDLSAKLYSFTSLFAAEKSAVELGFTSPTSVIYLKDDKQVANLP